MQARANETVRERYWIPGRDRDGCLTYGGRQFFLPPIKNESLLPLDKFKQYRRWEGYIGASLEQMPLDILQHIFSYLLDDSQFIIFISSKPSVLKSFFIN